MRQRWLLLIALVTFGVSVSGGAALAQLPELPEPGAPAVTEPAPPATPPPAATPAPPAATPKPQPKAQGESVFTIVMKYSGAPGWTIILMSIFAVYMIVRFSVQFTRKALLPEGLIIGLEQDLDNMRVREAVEKCKADISVLARVVGGGLANIRGGHQGMTEVMDEVAEAESIRIHQQVGWLSIIGAIAPMLGLTGTVLGMIQAFAVIAASEQQPSARALAGNIQLALVTTCEGLIVAVPVLLAFAFFKNKVTTLMLEVGVAATDLIDRFRDVEITPAMTAGTREAVATAQPAPMAPELDEPEELDESEPPPPPPA